MGRNNQDSKGTDSGRRNQKGSAGCTCSASPLPATIKIVWRRRGARTLAEVMLLHYSVHSAPRFRGAAKGQTTAAWPLISRRRSSCKGKPQEGVVLQRMACTAQHHIKPCKRGVPGAASFKAQQGQTATKPAAPAPASPAQQAAGKVC